MTPRDSESELPPSDSNTAILVAMARLEAKLDQALTGQNDHENRLRDLEAKSTVSPRTLWTAILGAVGAFAAVSPLLERFFAA